MKRTTYSFLLLMLICSVVLTAPSGMLAALSVQATGCSPCPMGGQGAGNCFCCTHQGKPNHCGASGQESNLNCRCSCGNLASIDTPDIGPPSWQVIAHVPAGIKIASKSFAPNIFHPPEIPNFPCRI
ncbi:MAG: hypothetical protein M1438_11865 [Deltaproteobacteria bacterium]|nr:hypothetical protein [Deltaproteobacteria bacterium]